MILPIYSSECTKSLNYGSNLEKKKLQKNPKNIHLKIEFYRRKKKL